MQPAHLPAVLQSACRFITAAAIAIAILGASRPAIAYSVLAHETMVDALWRDEITPVLRARFPRATSDELMAARAYAYGGAVIQDLGYYPFGSKLFSNLVHYVRSGDFIEALIRDARDPNELAFALGALAHYASDNVGHPAAINRAVPLIYPKLRARFGDEVIYAQSPSRHLKVEFAFDVLQTGTANYAADAYRDFIGFEVAKPALERAFFATYGLELDDVFLDVDLAIGTFRYAVSTLIPEMTRLAWKDKQDEILQRTPGIQQNAFVFAFTRQDFERQFGAKYKKPGVLSRVLYFLIKIIPKVGPFKPLGFEPLSPEAARLLVAGFTASRERYRELLHASTAQAVSLPNTDFDTGQTATGRRNPLADETYAELLDELAEDNFRTIPSLLRADIVRHYNGPRSTTAMNRKERKRLEKAQRQLAAMSRSSRVSPD
jgi:hypothetical protein